MTRFRLFLLLILSTACYGCHSLAALDSDGDGLTDQVELHDTRTNPYLADSDQDGLSDQVEIAKSRTDPWNADTDEDGLSDRDEVRFHTNPHLADTDSDGLTDGEEWHRYRISPALADTDGDSLMDGEEVFITGTDPLLRDTDGDDTPDNRDGCPLIAGDPDEKGCVAPPRVKSALILPTITFKERSLEYASDSERQIPRLDSLLSLYNNIRVIAYGYVAKEELSSGQAVRMLSWRRAMKVRDDLIRLGIDPTRVLARVGSTYAHVTGGRTQAESAIVELSCRFLIWNSDEGEAHYSIPSCPLFLSEAQFDLSARRLGSGWTN
jgi:hypothetical protein